MMNIVSLDFQTEHVAVLVWINEVTYIKLNHIPCALVEFQPSVLHHVYRLLTTIVVECEIYEKKEEN